VQPTPATDPVPTDLRLAGTPAVRRDGIWALSGSRGQVRLPQAAAAQLDALAGALAAADRAVEQRLGRRPGPR